MNLILEYVSDEEEDQLEEHLFCKVGGNALENGFTTLQQTF